MNFWRTVKNLIIIVYTLAVTYMAGEWAVRSAFEERGYEAIGGEFLFIPVVAWISYKAIRIFLELLEGKRNG